MNDIKIPATRPTRMLLTIVVDVPDSSPCMSTTVLAIGPYDDYKGMIERLRDDYERANIRSIITLL